MTIHPSGSADAPESPRPCTPIIQLCRADLRGERIAELTLFLGPDHFAPFGLAPSLP